MKDLTLDFICKCGSTHMRIHSQLAYSNWVKVTHECYECSEKSNMIIRKGKGSAVQVCFDGHHQVSAYGRYDENEGYKPPARRLDEGNFEYAVRKDEHERKYGTIRNPPEDDGTGFSGRREEERL